MKNKNQKVISMLNIFIIIICFRKNMSEFFVINNLRK